MAHDIADLECIEIEQGEAVQTSVIWLHGLGADGADFVPIVDELHLPKTAGIRFIFPNAPVIPITINNGHEMRAWYDIASATIEGIADKPGIEKSMAQVERLIEKEVERGIPVSNIILGGFSQGAAIALTTGLRYRQALGGVIALSGYLPLIEDTLRHASAANRHLPIFLAHGTIDPIVPFDLGKAAYMYLQKEGYPVSWHAYPIAHTVCVEEVSAISRWLLGVAK
jgi:phospholipase/carboxylesterase